MKYLPTFSNNTDFQKAFLQLYVILPNLSNNLPIILPNILGYLFLMTSFKWDIMQTLRHKF